MTIDGRVLRALAESAKRDRLATALLCAILVEDEEDPWTSAAVKLERAVTTMKDTELPTDQRTRKGRLQAETVERATELAEQAAKDCRTVAELQSAPKTTPPVVGRKGRTVR